MDQHEHASVDAKPEYPEIGELLCVNHEDTEEIVEVVKDHGMAKLYTVSSSDGKERLVAMDEHGVMLDVDSVGH